MRTDFHEKMLAAGAEYERHEWHHPVLGDVVAHLYTGGLPSVELWASYPTLEEAVRAHDRGQPRMGAHYWDEDAYIYYDGLSYQLLYVTRPGSEPRQLGLRA
jgi:hypothetical protein